MAYLSGSTLDGNLYLQFFDWIRIKVFTAKKRFEKIPRKTPINNLGGSAQEFDVLRGANVTNQNEKLDAASRPGTRNLSNADPNRRVLMRELISQNANNLLFRER